MTPGSGRSIDILKCDDEQTISLVSSWLGGRLLTSSEKNIDLLSFKLTLVSERDVCKRAGSMNESGHEKAKSDTHYYKLVMVVTCLRWRGFGRRRRNLRAAQSSSPRRQRDHTVERCCAWQFELLGKLRAY